MNVYSREPASRVVLIGQEPSGCVILAVVLVSIMANGLGVYVLTVSGVGGVFIGGGTGGDCGLNLVVENGIQRNNITLYDLLMRA